MSRENALDRRVKDALIRDTVALVDPIPFDRGAVVGAIERRRRSNQSSRVHEGTTGGQPAQSHRRELACDLDMILRGRLPRRVGEKPRFVGAYELLCPKTPSYTKIQKIKRGLVK